MSVRRRLAHTDPTGHNRPDRPCPNGQTTQFGPGSGAPCAQSGCYHGNHVSGIAVGNGDQDSVEFSGVAKGANLIGVQVFQYLNGGLYTFWSDLIAALEWVYEQRSTIDIASVNMSLGNLSAHFSGPCDDDPMKPIIDNLRAAGIATVVASMNNGYKDGMSTPACISSTVSVGATGRTDQVASFSNLSQHTSLLAPGVDIVSSVLNGAYGNGAVFATLPCSGTTCSGNAWWATGSLPAGSKRSRPSPPIPPAIARCPRRSRSTRTPRAR